MKKNFRRIISALSVAAMLLSLFMGCAANEESETMPARTPATEVEASPSIEPEASTPSATEEISSATAAEEVDSEELPVSEEPSQESIVASAVTEVPVVIEETTVATETSASDVTLSETQRNSISMLNYLVVLTQEINASKNSRLYLEEVYSELINNILPNAVDHNTMNEIQDILDTLEAYRMIDVKRERLEYIYEQNQAQAMRGVLPNPVALLGAVRSQNYEGLLSSVVYMAVDSLSSYLSGMTDAELSYLQSGWALDDEESNLLHESRSATFEYMVDMVNDNNLPGELALNEQMVQEFVSWTNHSNNLQVIQFFEANESTYYAFGPYWLALMRAYYDNGDFNKCLDALSSYEATAAEIFRKDYDLASVLPLAIASAREVLAEDEYVLEAQRHAAAIMENSDNKDWALRYFAAQTYLDIYSLTEDETYLNAAYNIVLNNVNTLVGEQRELNEAYILPVVEMPIPEGASKDRKNEIRAYNKMREEERTVALPPLYEPLLLNCDLLFALAEEIGISEAEAVRVDGILHENGEALFLIESVDDRYWISKERESAVAEIIFDGDVLMIPVSCVSEEAVITVTVFDGEKEYIFADWQLSKVERDDENNFVTFMATYESALAGEHKFTVNSEIHIEIDVKEDLDEEGLYVDFIVVGGKTFFVFNSVEFQRIEV